MSASRSQSCLADSPALAEDAVGAIALDWRAVTRLRSPRFGADAILLFEASGTNSRLIFTAVKGDADAAFRDADYVRRERFTVQRHTAMPMETRGVLANGMQRRAG